MFVHLYKGPDFIPDRGPKIASPPLMQSNIMQCNAMQCNVM